MQIGPMGLRNQLQVKHEKVVGSRRVLYPPHPLHLHFMALCCTLWYPVLSTPWKETAVGKI